MHRPLPMPRIGNMEELATLEEIMNMLLECEMFSSFDRFEIGSIAAYFNYVEVKKGEEVFKEGDPGTFMCIVHTGTVSIFKSDLEGNVFEIAKLPSGRPFGEMALLDGERRSATCKAATDCGLLTLSKDALDSMVDESPATAARVVRAVAISLSRRLRMADGQLIDRRRRNAY